jgi:alkylated DNA repair dioxygenase AlkB
MRSCTGLLQAIALAEVLPRVRLDMSGAEIHYYPTIDLGMNRAEALARLADETNWRHDSVTLFGKTHPQPRLHAWVGDADCAYTYSGLRLVPEPWTPLLAGLRRKVEEVAGTTFNSVLLNFYRDGQDCMGLHADDEPELGRRPVIASLSLGACRRLDFRSRSTPSEKSHIMLEDGSLLVMAGETQRNWKHGISRSRRILDGRINLTFRKIIQTRTDIANETHSTIKG